MEKRKRLVHLSAVDTAIDAWVELAEPHVGPPDGTKWSGGWEAEVSTSVGRSGLAVLAVSWSRPYVAVPARQTTMEGADASAPSWARVKGSKASPALVADAVVEILADVRGKDPDKVAPHRCATDAKPLIGLWRELGYPELGTFVQDFLTVARWARESSDPLAQRDIRGQGWAGGVDRSRSVSTLCRREKWGDRLEAARAWLQGAPPPGSATLFGGRGDAAPVEERRQAREKWERGQQ